jgi:predicted metal-dependent enzyme (double-stranded beta helix superfamily)
MNWLVNETGICENLLVPSTTANPAENCYRLYRFLTDLEDILTTVPSDRHRISAICPLVNRLLSESYWWQVPEEPADPELGWGVQTLYDEPFFDLTVQLVTWLPGSVSEIHNHATWGIIAIISGSEKNTLWQRSPTPDHPDKIMRVGEQVVEAGDMIGFLPDAIHQIEVLGEEPTISLNLYGKTDYDARFEFDPELHIATIY